MIKKVFQIFFIGLCLVLMLVPTLGMIYFQTTTTKENTTLADLPELVSAQGVNVNYLGDLGEYYEDHFAFKEPLITLNNLLLSNYLMTSGQDNVILGKNGQLFFLGEIVDYEGINAYSARDLFNISRNLRLIQDYIEANGSRFVLTIVPNKSTVYASDVPDQYLRGQNSLEALEKALMEAGVNYVSLVDTLESEEDPYFKLDTHWNNSGALAGYNKLMEALGLEKEDYQDLDPDVSMHSGDLSNMLYPSLNLKEAQDDYSQYYTFAYSEADNYVESTNDGQDGVLLLYADSYGDALFPYLANAFGYARKENLTPMNLIQIESLHPDEVIIERSQRRFNFFQESAPIMIMPELSMISSDPLKSDSTLEISKSGSFYQIQGQIDASEFKDDTRIYCKVSNPDGQDHLYPVFYIGKMLYDDDGVLEESLLDQKAYDLRNHGYALYLTDKQLPEGSEVSILIKNPDQKAQQVVSGTVQPS